MKISFKKIFFFPVSGIQILQVLITIDFRYFRQRVILYLLGENLIFERIPNICKRKSKRNLTGNLEQNPVDMRKYTNDIFCILHELLRMSLGNK